MSAVAEVFSCLSLFQLLKTAFCFEWLQPSAAQTTGTTDAVVLDFCLNESFNVTCDPGHVILVDSAVFGRMRSGRCIVGEFNIGCRKDVGRFFDVTCNFRSACDVSVRGLVDFHPCQRDFVSYLEIGYECVLVYGLLDSSCPPDGTQRLSSSSSSSQSTGYLTRSPFHSVGSESCPWTLTADPGQRLNLSIIHRHVTFDSDDSDSAHHPSSSSSSSSSSTSSSSCSTAVVIDDVIAVRRTRVDACAERRHDQKQQQQQRRHLVTSAGNALTVHVTGSNVLGTDFLLRYSAVGCPEIRHPSNAWAKTIGEGRESAVVRCNDSMETWYLTCHGNRWHGDIGNCSQKRPQTQLIDMNNEMKRFMFNGVGVAVVIGILLGGFLGLAMLAIVFLARRRSVNGDINAATSLLLTSKQMSGLQSSSHQPKPSKITRRCSPGTMGLERGGGGGGLVTCGRDCPCGAAVGNKPFASLVLARHGHVTQPCPSEVIPQDLLLADVECTQHRGGGGGGGFKTVLLRAVAPHHPNRGCRQLGVEKEEATFLSANTVDLLERTPGCGRDKGVNATDAALSMSPSTASFRPSHVGTPIEEEEEAQLC